ncbi:MAG: hypothetical protein K0R08_1468 [Solimicrobium sp.]|nr:hypothetical protein [Solimicrobium sp.]
MQKYSNASNLISYTAILSQRIIHGKSSYSSFHKLLTNIDKHLEGSQYEIFVSAFSNVFRNDSINKLENEISTDFFYNLQYNSFLIHSYMLHSIGIKMLYQRDVNTHYYNNNKPILKKESIELNNEVLSYLKMSCFQNISSLLRNIYINSTNKYVEISLENAIQDKCIDFQAQIDSSIFTNHISLVISKLTRINSNKTLVEFNANELDKINDYISGENSRKTWCIFSEPERFA